MIALICTDDFNNLTNYFEVEIANLDDLTVHDNKIEMWIDII
jgi:hypothetical protein